MKIVDYHILWALSAKELTELVVDAMRDGWQPCGGVAVALNGHPGYGQVLYTQAIVKYGEIVNRP